MESLSVTEQYRAKTDILGDKLCCVSFREIEKYILDYVNSYVLYNNIPIKVIDAVVYGSRSRGNSKPDSDIDVAVEYENIDNEYKIKEYALFNLINEEDIFIDGYKIDINPISAEETGTLDDFLFRAEKYQSKSNNSIIR